MTQPYPRMATHERTGGLPAAHPRSRYWIHEPGVVYLNHGSFGGCPAAVLETQAAWRARLEGEPVRFFVEDLFDLFDWAREDTARFLGCDPAGLVFVPNATTGVATAIHNLIASGQASAGDELLVTDHEYKACVNNARQMAQNAGLSVVVAELPFPDPTPSSVLEAVLGAVTPRTRIALVSQITSVSGMLLPAHDLVRELESRGVRVVLDGAHAPGHVRMGVDELGASYYTANLHKWVCSPKGSAVLHAHADQRERCRPMILSNMANSPMPGRSHLHTEFDYVGTADPTAVLCVPAALRIMASIARGEPPKRGLPEAFNTRVGVDALDNAWAAIRAQNRSLALRAQALICERLGVGPPVPPGMTACLAMIGLPNLGDAGWAQMATRPARYDDPMQDRLVDRWGVQVPIVHPSGGSRSRCVRVSAQLYNSLAQCDYLADALAAELENERNEQG